MQSLKTERTVTWKGNLRFVVRVKPVAEISSNDSPLLKLIGDDTSLALGDNQVFCDAVLNDSQS